MSEQEDAASEAALDEIVRQATAIARGPDAKLTGDWFRALFAAIVQKAAGEFAEVAADAHWLLLAALEDSDDGKRREAFKAVMDRLPVTPETLAAAQGRTIEWNYGILYMQRLPDLEPHTVAMRPKVAP